ncbi:hypothetical protein DBP15_15415 [Streptomyces sp. CS065A]|nr:hypothetical protein DBP15_15415 [Streptomyces sp. CS065A]
MAALRRLRTKRLPRPRSPGARSGSDRNAGPSCPARTAAVSGRSRIAPLVRVPALTSAFASASY